MNFKNTLIVYIFQFPLYFVSLWGVHFLTGLGFWWSVPIVVVLDLMYYVGENVRRNDWWTTLFVFYNSILYIFFFFVLLLEWLTMKSFLGLGGTIDVGILGWFEDVFNCCIAYVSCSYCEWCWIFSSKPPFWECYEFLWGAEMNTSNSIFISNFISFLCGVCTIYFLLIENSWWGLVFLVISPVMTGNLCSVLDKKWTIHFFFLLLISLLLPV